MEIDLNYKEIGQRIRNLRRLRGLSQEELSEAVDISVTHMSHIETGSTKLSLPVCAKIARALQASMDEIIFISTTDDKADTIESISGLLQSSSSKDARIILDTIRTLKDGLAHR